jgi:hypothetical protein
VGPADIDVHCQNLLVFSFSPRYRSMKAAICCRRERLVERSQKVHGEAKAGGDPAGMDAGSRPLTMDGNWPGRSPQA